MPAAEYVSPEGLRLDGRFVARCCSAPITAQSHCTHELNIESCRSSLIGLPAAAAAVAAAAMFISLLPMICRRPKELRQLRAELGVLSSATGSALFEMGNTKVLLVGSNDISV